MKPKKIWKEKVRRLARWARGEPAAPVRIDLEPTYGCNLLCKFCWQRDPYRVEITNYKNAISEERLYEIVHEAGRMGVLDWQIAGGWEPMVKPRVAMRIMNLIKEYGMRGCLTTNGTLFKDDSIRNLVEVGWDQILFSLEGPDAETHDYLTGVSGSFDKSVAAMMGFKEWKSKLGRDDPQYSFHTVLTNRNYDKIPEMLEWGNKLGVCGVNFEPINVWSEDGEKLKLSPEQMAELPVHLKRGLKANRRLYVPTNIEQLLETRLVDKSKMDEILKDDLETFQRGKGGKQKRSESSVRGDDDGPQLVYSPCFEPWLNIEIRASGHVVECRLCDYQDDAEMIQEKSLDEIWYGGYLASVRERIIKGDLPPYCRTCAAGIVVDLREVREALSKQLGRGWM